MVPIERRRLLQAAVGALTAVAGCNDVLSGSSTVSRSVPRESTPAADLPAHHAIRNPGDGPAAWFADEETPTPGEESRRHYRHDLVASESRAAELRFADVDGAAEARSFVADTEFSTATMYVESRSVPACYELSLCNVRWNAEEIETDYGSVLRDADAACEADARDVVAMLIRIPEALDPERYTGYSSSWGSSPCHARRPPERDPTDHPQYGPASTNASSTNATSTNATEAER